ncbi:hypothetical protein J1614_003321 [Plenodomus biglobosus]|nr:hypothetical protein J1614_003321 [Plenodomus biglobosus]
MAPLSTLQRVCCLNYREVSKSQDCLWWPRLAFGFSELRNRIYDFAVENWDKVTGQFEKLLFLSPAGKTWTDDSCYNCGDWDQSPNISRRVAERSFYGLTQVCRQIRAEYLLLYRTRTKTHVPVSYIDEYIDVFVTSAGTDPTNIAGNIVIWFASCIQSIDDDDVIADLTHLINFEYAAPRLKLDALIDDCEKSIHKRDEIVYINLLFPLMNSSRYSNVHRFLDASVNKVEVVHQYKSHHVKFWIKEGGAESWMFDADMLSKLGLPCSDVIQRASRAYWNTSHPFKVRGVGDFIIFDIPRPEVEFARTELSYQDDGGPDFK